MPDPEDRPDDDGLDEAPDGPADAPDEDLDGPADAPAPLTRADLAGGGTDRSRLGPIVLGGIAVLLVGFIIGRVTSDDDGTAEATTTTTPPPVTFPTGDQDRAGYWAFGGVTPAVADSFEGAVGDGLGAADSGGRWEPVSGSWSVENGTAAAAAGEGDEPSMIVIPGGPAERLTEATLTVVEEGAGIVFRYQDPDDYWSMTAKPSVGIWTVTRVVEGEPTVVAEIPATTADGTTVTVAQRRDELQILVDGIEAIRVTDPALRAQRLSGLITAPGSDGSARFDRFYVGAMPTL